MIIGITGPSGAGKDTAAEYIEKEYGFKHVSGGDILREKLQSIGLEPKRTVLGDFGTFIRTHYGADAVLKMVKERADGEVIVTTGFRSIEEARIIAGSAGG